MKVLHIRGNLQERSYGVGDAINIAIDPGGWVGSEANDAVRNTALMFPVAAVRGISRQTAVNKRRARIRRESVGIIGRANLMEKAREVRLFNRLKKLEDALPGAKEVIRRAARPDRFKGVATPEIQNRMKRVMSIYGPEAVASQKVRRAEGGNLVPIKRGGKAVPGKYRLSAGATLGAERAFGDVGPTSRGALEKGKKVQGGGMRATQLRREKPAQQEERLKTSMYNPSRLSGEDKNTAIRRAASEPESGLGRQLAAADAKNKAEIAADTGVSKHAGGRMQELGVPPKKKKVFVKKKASAPPPDTGGQNPPAPLRKSKLNPGAVSDEKPAALPPPKKKKTPPPPTPKGTKPKPEKGSDILMKPTASGGQHQAANPPESSATTIARAVGLSSEPGAMRGGVHETINKASPEQLAWIERHPRKYRARIAKQEQLEDKPTNAFGPARMKPGYLGPPEQVALSSKQRKRADRKSNRFGIKSTAKDLGGAMAVGVGVTKGAEAVKDVADQGNSERLRQGVEGQFNIESAASGLAGNLLENYTTWKTRKRVYGPSGRKSKSWRYDWLNKYHVKAGEGMSDPQFKRYIRSTADITIPKGTKTIAGVPIRYTFSSNDRKQRYAGKTIGMRQRVISNYKKLGKDLPAGFENLPFDQVNALFKKHSRHGWYKRNFKKAPITRRLYIHAMSAWNKAKDLLKRHGAAENKESAIMEDAVLVESAPVTDTASAEKHCLFMEGAVKSPAKCDCDDCLSVMRNIQETQKELNEGGALSSNGQLLRSGTRGKLPVAEAKEEDDEDEDVEEAAEEDRDEGEKSEDSDEDEEEDEQEEKKKKIDMTKKDYKKEHKHLLKVLHKGKKGELKKEAKKQKHEMKKELGESAMELVTFALSR